MRIKELPVSTLLSQSNLYAYDSCKYVLSYVSFFNVSDPSTQTHAPHPQIKGSQTQVTMQQAQSIHFLIFLHKHNILLKTFLSFPNPESACVSPNTSTNGCHLANPWLCLLSQRVWKQHRSTQKKTTILSQ